MILRVGTRYRRIAPDFGLGTDEARELLGHRVLVLAREEHDLDLVGQDAGQDLAELDDDRLALLEQFQVPVREPEPDELALPIVGRGGELDHGSLLGSTRSGSGPGSRPDCNASSASRSAASARSSIWRSAISSSARSSIEKPARAATSEKSDSTPVARA